MIKIINMWQLFYLNFLISLDKYIDKLLQRLLSMVTFQNDFILQLNKRIVNMLSIDV